MNRKVLSIAIGSALLAPGAAHAVKYKLSGQVNRAVVFMDDGEQSDVRNVDNDWSGTRWRLVGSEDLGSGMKVGFFYEMQTSSAPSSAAFPDQDTDGANGVSAGSNIRQANVWFSGNWGKLSMGQLDGAANGAAESDLSGTGISGNSVLAASFTGGIAWRTGGGGTIGGLTVGSTFSDFDGFSRYDGIRYDTPALGPVTVSASIGNDSKWDAAARVDTGLGGGRLSGALFYGEASGALNIDNRWGGSLSYLFSQGTSITGSYAENETQAGTDGTNWYVKIGHKWGPHAVGIGYGESDSVSDAVNGFETTSWNLGYVHTLKKANADLYAGFSFQELDVPAGTTGSNGGTSAEDVTAFVVGARVKFD